MSQARDKQIAALARRDYDRLGGSPNIKPISARVRPGRHRIDDIGAMLVESPGDPVLTFAYVEELVSRFQRQIRGELKLGPTFSLYVKDMKQRIRDALPTHTRRCLVRLAKMTIDEPVRVADYRMLAFALSIHGELCRWLDEGNAQHYEALGLDASATAEDVREAYKRLAMKYHPDRNPTDPSAAEQFRRIHAAYEALQGRVAHEDSHGTVEAA